MLQFLRNSITTTHGRLGGTFRSRIGATLRSAEHHLRPNWSLLNPEGGEGKGGADTDVRGDDSGSAPTPASGGGRWALPLFRSARRPRLTPTHPPKVPAPDSREKKHRLVSEVPLQVPLPLCLRTSALGRHGRCGYLAKQHLIGGGGAASLQLQPRFPALSPAPRSRPWGWRARRYMGAGLRGRLTASCSEAVRQ